MDSNVSPGSSKIELTKAAFAKVKVEGKSQIKASVAKEKSSAKSASLKKHYALSEAAEKAEAANARWERPNLNALCRKLCGGDMAAGLLLFHVLYLWRNRKHKLSRHGKQWLAHKREAWADASGLTFDELTKRALPRLKTHGWEFLTVKAMGHGQEKKLWISVDEIALKDAISGSAAMPWDTFYAAISGIGPGNEKKPANAYSDPLKGQ